MKAERKSVTVSELTRQIKSTLEQGFPVAAVEGEISNYKHHSSGHLYFTIKDEHAQIQAVLWRSRAGNLRFTPGDGMKIVARGRGDLQLQAPFLRAPLFHDQG